MAEPRLNPSSLCVPLPSLLLTLVSHFPSSEHQFPHLDMKVASCLTELLKEHPKKIRESMENSECLAHCEHSVSVRYADDDDYDDDRNYDDEPILMG